MENLEDEDFYRNLPRKELQDLCKKHGLSVNKTNSRLAKLLVSYFQTNVQKNAGSAASEERCSGSMEVFPSTSSIPQLKSVGKIHRRVHERGMESSDADSCGPSHCSKAKERSDHRNPQTVTYNELCSHVEDQMSHKASGGTVNMNLNDPSSNGTAEGFGCSTYDIQENKTDLHFGCHCVCGFNSEKNESQKSTEARNSDQNLQDSTRDGGADDIPQIQCRNINSSACITENGPVSSVGTSTKEPPSSFQFDVRSEEGINLYVDLSSNPSDWIEGLKSQVCMYQEVHNSKSRVLHQELKSLGDINEKMKISSLTDIKLGLQTKGDPVCTGSSISSIVKESGQLQADHHPGITDGSLRSSSVLPCNTPVEISEHLEDDDQVLPNSDGQILMVSGTEACLGDGDIVSLDSGVPDTSQIKSTCNSILDIKLDGPNCPDSLKHTNSKFGITCPEDFKRCIMGTSNVSQDRDLPVSSEICEDSVPFNTACFDNPSEVYPGCSTSVSVEMQLSEVASHYKGPMNSVCQNFRPLKEDMMHSTQTENVDSADCELDQNTCGDPPSAINEEWNKSSPINERESSECSQIDNSFKRTCKRSNSSEYPEGLQSKRPRTNRVDQSGSTKPVVKNLRSSKQLAREVLPRRSSRLASK